MTFYLLTTTLMQYEPTSITETILTGNLTREEIAAMFDTDVEDVENIELEITTALKDTQESEEEFVKRCDDIDRCYRIPQA